MMDGGEYRKGAPVGRRSRGRVFGVRERGGSLRPNETIQTWTSDSSFAEHDRN